MISSQFVFKFALFAVSSWGVLPLANAEPLFITTDIFPPGVKHTHSSSIVQCPNGDLLACWFHGSGERSADDVLVQGARLKKGAKRWGPVFEMADTPGFPDCNPILHIDPKGRLRLFWISVLAHRWECGLLKFRRAEDYQGAGAPKWSWQGIVQLKPGPEFAQVMKQRFDELKLNTAMWAEYAQPYEALLLKAANDPFKRQTGWMPRTHPLTLPGGRILLPLYSDGFNASLVAISDDDGDSWRASQPIIGLGPIQPSLARQRNGTIIAFCRDSGPPPFRVMASLSRDNGETWSAARDTDIPNPGSSLEVIVLRDGRWLIVYNDSTKSRDNLTVAISEDEGKNLAAEAAARTAKRRGHLLQLPLGHPVGGRRGAHHVHLQRLAGGANTPRHPATGSAQDRLTGVSGYRWRV